MIHGREIRNLGRFQLDERRLNWMPESCWCVKARISMVTIERM
jgi:hypothetical protein